MFEVTNRLSPPYSSICYLRCDWADGTSTRASGVVVGPNDVLTALHAVYASDKGWATRVTIIPGADTSPVQRPFGEYADVGTIVGRSLDWDPTGDGLLSREETQGDMALIGLRSRIGDVTGFLPMAQQYTDFSGLMAGYPGRGTGLMAESVFASAESGVYEIRSGLGAGASGGPLLTPGNAVAGVLSSGNAANTSSTYTALATPGTAAWFQAALQANDFLIGAPGTVAIPTGPGLGARFMGAGGGDLLVGGDGWDVFRGQGGPDTIDGGWGVDIAEYNGARASYTVSAQGDTVTVADSFATRDGTDTLRNVERVHFQDFGLAFDVGGSAGKAYRLYQTAFDRAPDAPGLGFHMWNLDNGQGLVQTARNFVLSPEFQARYGTPDIGQFVTLLYANVLKRAPDGPGFAYHTNNLASGAQSRAEVVVGFSESPENQAALVGVMSQGMLFTG